MSIWITVLLFLVGLALIVKGGDWFLDGAVWIAETTGVPRFIIGATIVSLATTLPELTVSVTGVLQGEVDLAVGNAVGSVTANLGLILGISIVCIPSAVNRKQFDLKALLMVTGALLLFLLCRNGVLPVLPGLLLFVVFAVYLANNVADARSSMAEGRDKPKRRTTSHRLMFMKLGLFVAGIAAIVTGSRLLIDYGSELALLLGVPSSIIGVTMVAIGTSLPELVTTLTAIAKKESSMSVGNIIGANVIDLTLILPVCSAASPGRQLVIASQTTALDLPVCLGLCCLAVLPPLLRGKFYRWQGALMLAGYAAYIAVLVS